MRSSKVKEFKTITVATRSSPLALAQTEEVIGQLRRLYPHLNFITKTVRTKGDKLQSGALVVDPLKLPKGLFTKELEQQLLLGKVDIAIHSLKDLPIELHPALTIGAIPKRADPREVLICRSEEGASIAKFYSGLRFSPTPTFMSGKPDILALPPGCKIGTCSLRRQWQLKAKRSDIEYVQLRGNVDTRLRKLLENPNLDAIIIAKAGLDRLGYKIDENGNLYLWQTYGQEEQNEPKLQPLPEYRAAVLEVDEIVPCAGQGALAIEIRKDDHFIESLVKPLDHYLTKECVNGERRFIAQLGGGCRSPVAVHIFGSVEKVTILVAAGTGETFILKKVQVGIKDLAKVIDQLAQEIKAKISFSI